MRLLGSEDASVLEVSVLLNSDPGFSAEMLTMANSAAHGSSNRIHTIGRAVVALGLERTRSLATKAALNGMIRGLGHHPGVENCWKHSLATALTQKWLAPFYRLNPDPVYVDRSHARRRRLDCLSPSPNSTQTIGERRRDKRRHASGGKMGIPDGPLRSGLFLAKTGLPENSGCLLRNTMPPRSNNAGKRR